MLNAISTKGIAWTRLTPTVLFFAYVLAAVTTQPGLFLQNLREFSLNIMFSLLPLGLLVTVGTSVASQPQAPLQYLLRHGRTVGVRLLTTAVGVTFGIAAFWTLKFQIPMIVPFYLDPSLATLDRALHSGDPWQWMHWLIEDRAMGALILIYFPAWLFLYFACIALAAVHGDPLTRRAYFRTFAAIYAGLGTLMAVGAASVGPIFYDRYYGGDRFSGLIDALRSNEASTPVLQIADRLFIAYSSGAEDIFAGISAMPSVHLAVATLNALFLRRISATAGAFGWVFVALTAIGSVYLGWHYAVDGYMAIGTVVVIWKFASMRGDNG
ncbi:phosphatase PAP2 family protein [Mesorhizobium sp.]|uniref:phosphatase PAP2 family protein n=1 Tax=Mesorhizobium sp. TaxID=1871066 RepID=UPI000FEA63DC|nr:phosphatase PAP2 family protein [Mesorhizobium sp.]RWA99471.1 MAG: hypothetical protein EOQ33_24115 [Mesorhizobium sp.]